VVEERFRDADLGRDPTHRQLLVGVAGEELGPALEQLAAALVDVEAAIGGIGHRPILLSTAGR